jgi:butyryl-CoA dehydrogenase
MSIRCYVGDAMVYRVLGDVDRALGAVDPSDAAAVLQTIEAFAVECSVNKVYSSEALAYVVDEALQVFGGNGYSREFPAERAYRDARITRIYEGTNEINRLLIPTRLLKQSVQAPATEPRAGEGPLRAEHALLADAKRLILALLAEVSATFGDAVREEQEVLGHAADIAIDVYAIDSTLARAGKVVAARGIDAAGVPLDIARVYASDAADRMAHAARQIVRALAARDCRTGFHGLVTPIVAFAGVDGITARRRIADAVVAAGRHPF